MAFGVDRALGLARTCSWLCLIIATTHVQVWVGLNLAPALVNAEAGAGSRRRISRMRLDPMGESGPQLASLVLPRHQATTENDADL